MKKVTIIGAGPAGLFTAYKLVTDSEKKLDIQIIDAGGTIEQRVSAKNKDVLHGIGGAGLMSDGKLIFDTRVGNNLNEVMSQKENERLTNEVKNIFESFGAVESEIDSVKALEFRRKAMQSGIEFLCSNQGHIGTDRLIPLMKDFQNYLVERGVSFICNTEVQSLDEESDFFVLVPGRVSGGSGWMEKILKEKGIEYSYRPVDIGVRVETPSIITDLVTEISRDMKCYIKTKTYQDNVRTFCTCPNGFVGHEEHKFVNREIILICKKCGNTMKSGICNKCGQEVVVDYPETKFNTVNGHSESGKSTENTNFALLVTIPMTKPLTNSNQYARNIGLAFHDLSGGKTIAQRWGDLIRYQRSKERKQKDCHFRSTLEDLTWGDLALAMPARYLTDLIEGMEKLNMIIPGLTSDETILHAPEIKFHGLLIPTDAYFRTEKGIYVGGDGSGYTRGIVGSAASGLRVAEGILREI